MMYNNGHYFINFDVLLVNLSCHDLIAIKIDGVNMIAQGCDGSIYVKYFEWYMKLCMKNSCSNNKECKKLMYSDIYDKVYDDKIIVTTVNECKNYLICLFNNNSNINHFQFDTNEFVKYCLLKV